MSEKKATVVRHEQFRPHERPQYMDFIDGLEEGECINSSEFREYLINWFNDDDQLNRLSRDETLVALARVLWWARHLERVREGLQRQINQWEHAQQTELVKEHAARKLEQDTSTSH